MDEIDLTQGSWQMDIERLHVDIIGYVPFSVRYGYRKVSKYLEHGSLGYLPHNVAGMLWELVLSSDA